MVLRNKMIYHLVPPEHTLTENYNSLLNLARGVLIEHQPKAEEFTDTERTRHVFFNIAKDLLQDLADSKSMALSYNDLNKLATILVRHTIGFGLIEVLLQDTHLQDISLNANLAIHGKTTVKNDLYLNAYTDVSANPVLSGRQHYRYA